MGNQSLSHRFELVDNHDCTYRAEVLTMPIGEGASRVAFEATITEAKTRRGKHSKRDAIVVKRFKTSFDRIHSAKMSEPDMKASRKAIELAKEFTQLGNIYTSVEFVLPRTMKVTSTGRTTLQRLFDNSRVVPLQKGEWVFLEPCLTGIYQKWISNTGELNQHQDVLLAFVHWTCVKTNGQLLVCDLQGVNKHDGGFQLTDPAINSVTQEYGNTDLGKLGIYLFFALHECTGVCKRLKLTERVPEVIPPEITRLVREYAKAPTTYAELLSSITQINQNLPTPVLKAPPPPPSRTRSLRPSTRKRTRKCLIQ